jgi:hypothetical protein
MDLAHRQLVRGAPPGTGRAHVLVIEPSNGDGEGAAGGGQRGARRVRRRARGGPVPNLPSLELAPTADLIDVPGPPPTARVAGMPHGSNGLMLTPKHGHEGGSSCR